MIRLRRGLVSLALALGLSALFPAAAFAHPLGNFTVNHLSIVTVAPDGVRVRYILDLAEIPTLQETETGDALVSRIAAGLELRVGETPLPLAIERSSVERLPGQAGLETERVTVELAAPMRVTDGAAIRYRDLTFAGRVGWHDVVMRGAVGGASVGPDDPTNELRSYPTDATVAPPDRTEADARAALAASVGGTAEGAGGGSRFAVDASIDRLTAFLRAGNADLAALLAALVVAAILGALHALGPGHGKAIVAAYLVGSQGTPRDAVVLGATVTLTHTVGVYTLGLITLLAAQLFVPEQVYPVLSVLSGVLVTITGLGLLRSRLGRAAHGHDHPHGHDHGHETAEHHHGRVGSRGLLALGVSGGLLPCPTALVILLAAVSFHNVALGMTLVAAFSLGLAIVLTTVGLALVWSRGLLSRRSRAMAIVRSGIVVAAARYLPAASAAAIAVAGIVIAVQSVRGLS